MYLEILQKIQIRNFLNMIYVKFRTFSEETDEYSQILDTCKKSLKFNLSPVFIPHQNKKVKNFIINRITKSWWAFQFETLRIVF